LAMCLYFTHNIRPVPVCGGEKNKSRVARSRSPRELGVFNENSCCNFLWLHRDSQHLDCCPIRSRAASKFPAQEIGTNDQAE